jgi:hypothetical protein
VRGSVAPAGMQDLRRDRQLVRFLTRSRTVLLLLSKGPNVLEDRPCSERHGRSRVSRYLIARAGHGWRYAGHFIFLKSGEAQARSGQSGH